MKQPTTGWPSTKNGGVKRAAVCLYMATFALEGPPSRQDVCIARREDVELLQLVVLELVAKRGGTAKQKITNQQSKTEALGALWCSGSKGAFGSLHNGATSVLVNHVLTIGRRSHSSFPLDA